MPNHSRLPLSIKLEKKFFHQGYFNLLTILRNSGLLGQPGEGLGGGVGSVKLQSREHWAVATLQLIEFGFELFLGVYFEEECSAE